MPESEPRELRLEGGALWVAVALLLLALGGAFALGRWSVGPSPPPAAGPRADTGGAEQPAADVDRSAGGFDTAGVPEPGRQVSETAEPAPAPASAPASSAGAYHVQVFAGRDRQAATRIVDALQRAGWPVRLQSVEEGSGSLVKVRVGGYPTRAAAEAAAVKLRAQGQPGAWVTDSP